MFPREFDVSGRAVIVTGAGRGIGKGIVRVLAETGARVLATALTNTYLEPLAEELASAGTPIETLLADATVATDVERTLDAALARFGTIDVLINNVGDAVSKPLVPLPGDDPPTDPLSDEEWRFIIDVNLTEAFLGCRAIGPHFLEKRRGKVINIAGFAAKKGPAGLAAYSAAKAGLVRLTQVVALEWAPYGVTVNAIAPGFFPDPETSPPEAIEAADRRAATGGVPLRRRGDIRDVGLLACFLASDASNYVTCETIYIDGGVSFA